MPSPLEETGEAIAKLTEEGKEKGQT